MVPWKSRFELQVPAASPEKVLEAAARHTRRSVSSGLRLRVVKHQIRARYVVGAESEPSLMVATPIQRGSDTYLVGEVRWTAMYADLILKVVAPGLLGVAVLVWGLADELWQPVAIGGVVAILMGWHCLRSLRSLQEDQDVELALLAESLREAFSLGTNG